MLCNVLIHNAPSLSQVVLQKNLAKEPEPLDTRVPLDITEEEELERISGMLQRDNLVRGLGVVEHVYRLLHCTPGTTGYLKTAAERQYNVSTGWLCGHLSKLKYKV